MKVVKNLMITVISLTFLGSTSAQSQAADQDINANKIVEVEPIETPEQEVDKKELVVETEDNLENEPVEVEQREEVEKTLVEDRDGQYFSSLVASNNGERSEDYGAPFLFGLRIEGDILCIDGSIDYLKDPYNRNDTKEYENASYNFKLSSNVSLQAVGGLAEPKYYTREEFIEFYNEVRDSGLALLIKVENGIVTRVSISS